LNGQGTASTWSARDADGTIIWISDATPGGLDMFGSGINDFLDKAHLLQDLPLF
jgi:hypothetical protein